MEVGISYNLIFRERKKVIVNKLKVKLTSNMSIAKRKTKALQDFVKQYSVTSGDVQTFILGMQAMEKIYQDVQQDLKNECELNGLESQSVEC